MALGQEEKIAVVLFNLGGPDSREAIRPFLYNFFTDKNIIRLPFPFRHAIAWLIAKRRTQREAGSSYSELGYKSPLLENTQAQAQALSKELGAGYAVFVCMRYWHPMADAVAAAVKTYDPDRVVLLPLYPQFSTTTTRSSLQAWKKAARKAGLEKPVSIVCCYPEDEDFISASAALVRDSYDAMKEKTGRAPRVLFSAHGLPEDVITDGDPYQWQCERGAAAIAERLGIPDLDWALCYQSRVGPKKWIGPSTEDEIRRAGRDGIPLVIYPHAFVNEHVETLVEIELEYRHVAEECGVPAFARVPTVSVRPAFIAGLARMVRQSDRNGPVASSEGKRLCPPAFRRCCMQECP